MYSQAPALSYAISSKTAVVASFVAVAVSFAGIGAPFTAASVKEKLSLSDHLRPVRSFVTLISATAGGRIVSVPFS